ncbi:MAG: response regulator [Aquincola sp.]|nr:response regulator [Aquincola sp.]MDH4287429.1 response regulator [Aquincola sp.]MDH5328493.1 response regulator [Aquincola sp.]
MSEGGAARAHRVMLLGFGEFERQALASYLRLAGSRALAYKQVDSIADADFVIADADHPGAIDSVLAADRVVDTVFIGAQAPDGALAWAMRPIDPLQVFRDLDATVTLRQASRPAPAAGDAASASTPASVPAPLEPPMRRAGDVAQAPAALVVDDSEIAQRFLQRQLHALGLRTECAAHSARANKLLAEQRFDVVFLDVELGPMSEVDGLALCQHIKQTYLAPGKGLAPKVVMVSAHAGPTDRVRGTFAGCDAYMAKPMDDEALMRQLRELGILPDPDRKDHAKRRRRSSAASSEKPTPT